MLHNNVSITQTTELYTHRKVTKVDDIVQEYVEKMSRKKQEEADTSETGVLRDNIKRLTKGGKRRSRKIRRE